MVFPARWSMLKSVVEEGQIVGFETKDPTVTKGVSFVSEIDPDKISSTLNKVAKIIKLNKEKELKEVLYKRTIDELKKTFEQNDLDTLQNLYFDFEREEEPKLDYDEQYESGGEDVEVVGEREDEGQTRAKPAKRTSRTTNKETK